MAGAVAPRCRRAVSGRAGIATLLLLAPASLLFSVFVLYPIGASVVLSLYDWNGVGEKTFVGVSNYIELFHDPAFRVSLYNNLRWLACYALAPAAGIALAIFLSQPLRGMRAARSLFFLPFVISQVVVALIFGWFYHPRFGLLNEFLAVVGAGPVAPLENEHGAVYAMIAAGLWPQTAYCMMLFLTGLATLPADVIDAARVDGARGLSLFARVVVPQLQSVNFIVLMVCAVAALRSFDYVMMMTRGGPFGSSSVLAFFMVEQTFVASRFGYGAAIATVLLALTSGIIVALLVRLLRRERAQG